MLVGLLINRGFASIVKREMEEDKNTAVSHARLVAQKFVVNYKCKNGSCHCNLVVRV